MRKCHRFGLLVLVAGMVAGCGKIEKRYVVLDAKVTKSADLDDAMRAKVIGPLTEALDGFFGSPDEPKVSGSVGQVIKSDAASLKAGAERYRRLCMHCHGLSGDGAGPTAAFLNPRPRDYRRGLFKFTSTDKDTPKPTRDDLRRLLRSGIPGTSMPSFALYDTQDIENIIDYVILLSIRGEAEANVASDASTGQPVNADAVTETVAGVVPRWVQAELHVDLPKADRPESDAESIARGKKLFLDEKVQCVACHGREGRGDGLEKGLAKTATNIKNEDNWGDPLKPANLTLGVFRGGNRPIDVFRRMHAGIKGGRMPSQAGNLKDEQIWDLVNYVLALAYLDEAQPASH